AGGPDSGMIRAAAAIRGALGEIGAPNSVVVAPGTVFAKGGAEAEASLAFVSPDSLPDYAPPCPPGAAIPDEEHGLWIRTTEVVGGGSVYDVIGRQGTLIARYHLQPGRVIVGFGPGTVYMGVRDGAGTRLEATLVRVTP